MKKILSVILLIIFCYIYILPVNAKANDDYISINRNTKHLGSRLHKEYTGYIYKIKNISEEDVIIDGITFQDSITGEAAYCSVKRSSIAIGAKTIGTGLLFALPTLTLSLIGSVIIAPITMIGNTCGNIGAKQDSNRFDKQFKGGILIASAQIEVRILGVRFHRPTITVIYHTHDNNIHNLTY